MKNGSGNETYHFAAIDDVVQTYLDGIHGGSVPKLKQAMHADCRMICVSESRYSNQSMGEYFELVANRRSPMAAGEERRDEVWSVDLAQGEVAVVRPACLVLGRLCEDALTLVCEDGDWRIISKVYAYRMVGGLGTSGN